MATREKQSFRTFREALLKISDRIDESRLINLKSFLINSRDVPPECEDELRRCNSADELFKKMSDQQLASPENTALLRQILADIGLVDEATKLRDEFGGYLDQGSHWRVQSSERNLKPFKDFLELVANRIPGQHLPSLKLLCNKVLTRRHRDEIFTPGQLLLALYDKGVVSERDIGFLEALLKGEGLSALADEAVLILRRPHDLPLRKEQHGVRLQENHGEQEENVPLVHSACSEDNERPRILLPSGKEVDTPSDLLETWQGGFFKRTLSMETEPVPKRSTLAMAETHAINGWSPLSQTQHKEFTQNGVHNNYSMPTARENVTHDETSSSLSHSTFSPNHSYVSSVSLPSEVVMLHDVGSPSGYSSMSTDEWSSRQWSSPSPASTPCDVDHQSLGSPSSYSSEMQARQSPELNARERCKWDASEQGSPPITGYEMRTASFPQGPLPHKHEFSQCSYFMPQQYSNKTAGAAVRQHQPGVYQEKQSEKTEREPPPMLHQCPVISGRSSLEVYPLQRRGRALVINIEEFPENTKSQLSKRTGSQQDVDRLQKTFEWLGFKVEVKQNLTKDKLWEKMMTTSRDDHSNFDCFVCVLMSHGQMDEIFCTDGVLLSLSEVFSLFKHTRSLVGKPKMFFVQACRGKTGDTGQQISADGIDNDNLNALSKALPSDSDFLLGYATTPDRYSFRNEVHGSWYIHTLCDTLRKLVPMHESLNDILTCVNKTISDIFTDNGQRQIPAPVSTLRHRVVFPDPKCQHCTPTSSIKFDHIDRVYQDK